MVIVNSWITRSVRNAALLARTKVPDIKTTIVVDGSFPNEVLSVHCAQSF